MPVLNDFLNFIIFRIYIMIVFICILTCAQNTAHAAGVDQKSIQNKWHFVFFAEYSSLFGDYPGPPRFDVMNIEDNNKITLISTLEKSSFVGK